MSAASLARDAGALDAAIGVALLLAPWRPGRLATASRAFGLGLLAVSWVTLVASLLPREDAESLWDRLTSPAGAVMIAVAAVAGAALLLVLVQLIVHRPWTWFLMLALALPVRLPIPVGGESRNLLLPLYVVILAGAIAWLRMRRTGRAGPEGEAGAPIVDVPIAAFTAFTLVSTLWSSDTEEAAVKAVFFYIPFVVLYRLVLAMWPRADALRVMTGATLAMATPVALLALAQYALEWTFWNDRLEQANIYSRFFRVNGIFFDPNILGRYLAVAILCGVATAWLARERRTLLLAGAASTVCVAALVVTFSRSSTLMLIAGLVLLAWRAFGWRRTVLVTAVLGALLGGAAVAASDNVREAVTSWDRLERVSEGRFDLVRGGLEIWAEDPVAGTGLGAFAKRYGESLTPEERRKVRVVISHNAPVTVLTEVGVAGFALFLWLMVATAVGLGRAAGPPPPEREGGAGPGPRAWRFAAWTALAVVTGIFLHALLYSALFEDPYTWVVVGAGLAAGAAARGAEALTRRI